MNTGKLDKKISEIKDSLNKISKNFESPVIIFSATEYGLVCIDNCGNNIEQVEMYSLAICFLQAKITKLLDLPSAIPVDKNEPFLSNKVLS